MSKLDSCNKFDLSKLAENWPSPIVARGHIEKFSGGFLNPRTMANLDCKGLGPKGKFLIGGKIGYPVESVIAWMKSRLAIGRTGKVGKK